MPYPSMQIKDGKLILGEGIDAIEISGDALTMESLANRLISAYPDMYPWAGVDMPTADDLEYPPNNLPIEYLPGAIRELKRKYSPVFGLLSDIPDPLPHFEAALAGGNNG